MLPLEDLTKCIEHRYGCVYRGASCLLVRSRWHGWLGMHVYYW
jgi:hypothetical protein